MPYVDKELSRNMAKASCRPKCYICGKFIGEGGFYDVVFDWYYGGYEEGYSTCKEHTPSCNQQEEEKSND